MSKIFISYRREDSSDASGRIYDYLCAEFKPEYIFKDVDSIPVGEDFKIYIADKIKECRVMLVIIGNTWMTASNKNGDMRLQDPKDFVRIEIETAFANKLRVIPVLVGQATLPSSEALPPSLQKLIDINAISIRRDPDFRNDIKKLINYLENYLNTQTYNKARLSRLINNKLLIAFIILASILTIAYTYSRHDKNPIEIIANRSIKPTTIIPSADTITNKIISINAGNLIPDSSGINKILDKKESPIYHNIPPAYLIMRGAGARNNKQHLEATLNEPDMPKVASIHSTPQDIHKILDWLDVEENERYKSRGSQSYCNIYAADYCYLAGVYLPRVWWTQGAISELASKHKVAPIYSSTVAELNTNAIYSWLNSYGRIFGWQSVSDVDSLQNFANNGKASLIVAISRSEYSPGHISIVVPETDNHAALRQNKKVIIPLQSYAGAKNEKYTSTPDWWTSKRYKPFSYWVHK